MEGRSQVNLHQSTINKPEYTWIDQDLCHNSEAKHQSCNVVNICHLKKWKEIHARIHQKCPLSPFNKINRDRDSYNNPKKNLWSVPPQNIRWIPPPIFCLLITFEKNKRRNRALSDRPLRDGTAMRQLVNSSHLFIFRKWRFENVWKKKRELRTDL
jgi:hypothetical protein